MTYAIDELKVRYYQHASDTALFRRGAVERVGQWFCNRYVKAGDVYVVGTGTPLFYCEDARLCWRTIEQWLRDHHYQFTVPLQVREV